MGEKMFCIQHRRTHVRASKGAPGRLRGGATWSYVDCGNYPPSGRATRQPFVSIPKPFFAHDALPQQGDMQTSQRGVLTATSAPFQSDPSEVSPAAPAEPQSWGHRWPSGDPGSEIAAALPRDARTSDFMPRGDAPAVVAGGTGGGPAASQPPVATSGLPPSEYGLPPPAPHALSSSEYAALLQMQSQLAAMHAGGGGGPSGGLAKAGGGVSGASQRPYPAPYREPVGPSARAAPPGDPSPSVQRLFVGKLAMASTSESVHAYFAGFLWHCGFPDPQSCIKDVYLPCNAGQRPRGFAFVSFVDPAALECVVAHGGSHVIDGRRVVIDVAAPRGARVDVPGQINAGARTAAATQPPGYGASSYGASPHLGASYFPGRGGGSVSSGSSATPPYPPQGPYAAAGPGRHYDYAGYPPYDYRGVPDAHSGRAFSDPGGLQHYAPPSGWQLAEQQQQQFAEQQQQYAEMAYAEQQQQRQFRPQQHPPPPMRAGGGAPPRSSTDPTPRGPVSHGHFPGGAQQPPPSWALAGQPPRASTGGSAASGSAAESGGGAVIADPFGLGLPDAPLAAEVVYDDGESAAGSVYAGSEGGASARSARTSRGAPPAGGPYPASAHYDAFPAHVSGGGAYGGAPPSSWQVPAYASHLDPRLSAYPGAAGHRASEPAVMQVQWHAAAGSSGGGGAAASPPFAGGIPRGYPAEAYAPRHAPSGYGPPPHDFGSGGAYGGGGYGGGGGGYMPASRAAGAMHQPPFSAPSHFAPPTYDAGSAGGVYPASAQRERYFGPSPTLAPPADEGLQLQQQQLLGAAFARPASSGASAASQSDASEDAGRSSRAPPPPPPAAAAAVDGDPTHPPPSGTAGGTSVDQLARQLESLLNGPE